MARIVVHFGLKWDHMDVSTAFLYADLNKHRFKHLKDLISNFDVNDFISSKFK